MRRRGARGTAAATLLLALLGVGAVTGAPAQAATDPIGLSSDGVAFSSSYGANLFGGAAIVPGGTVTRSFWVKNRETAPGRIAVAIRDIGSADSLFVSSLTVSGDAGIGIGHTVAFTDVRPCSTLIERGTLAASGVARVDITLGLANTLTAREAQGSLAAFDIVVVLTSTDGSAPDGCIPPAPPVGGVGSAAPDYTGSVTIPGSGGAGADAGGSPELPDSGEHEADAGRYWNTDRFFQEYFVAWWLVAFLLGGACAWYRDRRRERIPE